jgi:platelet-activating factor acetylhydrolase isoform II
MKRILFLAGVVILGGVPMTAKAYSVGVKIFDLENGHRIIVWYPGVRPAGQEPFDHFGRARRVNAYLNANPDMSGAPYSLIIRSHGLGMGALDAVEWSVTMAKHGFVVVAFDHADASACKLDGTTDLDWDRANQLFFQYLKESEGAPIKDFDRAVAEIFADSMQYLNKPIYRTQEMSAVLDGVLAHSFFHGFIDPERIGAAGHSYGGATVLALGHEPVLDCTDPASYAPQICEATNSELSTSDFLPSQCCRESYQGELISFYDSRFKAFLAVGPGTFLFWPIQNNKPVMLISGDSFEVAWENMNKPFQAFPRVYWLIVADTDHMTWVDWIYNYNPLSALVLKGYQCYLFKLYFYEKYSIAFFQAHLNSDYELLDVLRRQKCPMAKFKYKL